MTSTLSALSADIQHIAAAASPGVVRVHARKGPPASGIVWKSGLIVTAEEAVETDDDIDVTLADGTRVAATLAGRDPTTDVALLRCAAATTPIANPIAAGGGHARPTGRRTRFRPPWNPQAGPRHGLVGVRLLAEHAGRQDRSVHRARYALRPAPGRRRAARRGRRADRHDRGRSAPFAPCHSHRHHRAGSGRARCQRAGRARLSRRRTCSRSRSSPPPDRPRNVTASWSSASIPAGRQRRQA